MCDNQIGCQHQSCNQFRESSKYLLPVVLGDLSNTGKCKQTEVQSILFLLCKSNDIKRHDWWNHYKISSKENIVDALNFFFRSKWAAIDYWDGFSLPSPFFLQKKKKKSLGASPRISMCHNNHVYLFPTPVCSIISYHIISAQPGINMVLSDDEPK